MYEVRAQLVFARVILSRSSLQPSRWTHPCPSLTDEGTEAQTRPMNWWHRWNVKTTQSSGPLSAERGSAVRHSRGSLPAGSRSHRRRHPSPSHCPRSPRPVFPGGVQNAPSSGLRGCHFLWTRLAQSCCLPPPAASEAARRNRENPTGAGVSQSVVGTCGDSLLGSGPLGTFLLARGSLWWVELCEPTALPELPSGERTPQGASGGPSPPAVVSQGTRPPRPPPRCSEDGDPDFGWHW